MRNAIEVKRNADVMMDAISAEDIADLPDAKLAESLQRLPGIALDRDNGEGKRITGLGSDFTRVRLNGLGTLTTTAASELRSFAGPASGIHSARAARGTGLHR